MPLLLIDYLKFILYHLAQKNSCVSLWDLEKFTNLRKLYALIDFDENKTRAYYCVDTSIIRHVPWAYLTANLAPPLCRVLLDLLLDKTEATPSHELTAATLVLSMVAAEDHTLVAQNISLLITAGFDGDVELAKNTCNLLQHGVPAKKAVSRQRPVSLYSLPPSLPPFTHAISFRQERTTA